MNKTGFQVAVSPCESHAWVGHVACAGTWMSPIGCICFHKMTILFQGAHERRIFYFLHLDFSFLSYQLWPEF